MTINKGLLLETLATIESHPELWNQGAWAVLNPGKPWVPDDVCGTSFCFAGHALAKEGYVPDYFGQLDPGQSEDYAVDATWFIPVKIAKKARKLRAKGEDDYDLRRQHHVEAEEGAMDILGLSWEQAAELFDGDNTLDDLRRIVFKFISEED